ncbi:histidinol-phosphatase HisJ family protein [Clostridium aminobutyricum]|uniref:Histidinol-phosphatase n=1 Tax=Clostridium aminobutyricum TaxID=33953 RepID=A0A939D720_CLOAM|nr:histidinol-phosphatase HisJ family protein [Clostridium aminobutyricum]MBN7772427.1 histidinol-phosphatase HisJ family protein [Clostridium aminobutyricum]
MYDYHTHSFFSDDCTTPIQDMIEAAIRKGVKELAITDHFDPDYPDPHFPFLIDFDKYYETLLDVEKKYVNQIKIIKGIEIGIQHGQTLAQCRKAANDFTYDFIIGSFHCVDNLDLYTGYFDGIRTTHEGFERCYQYVYDCLKEYKDFDVLGHINVIDRYAPNQEIPNYAPYMDQIEAILKLLIENGKGIEFNASCFRYLKDGRTTPSREILTLYKDLGGEILTYGSDAHNTANIADHFDEVMEMLKNIGFKYLTTFENRKPDFVKL